MQPPLGSRIETIALEGNAGISIPEPKGGPAQAFAPLFLLFWMGGWTVGGARIFPGTT